MKEVSRKDYNALTEDEQKAYDTLGYTVVDEQGLTDVEVKKITNELMAPINEKLEKMISVNEKNAEIATKSLDKEVNHLEIAGIQLKKIANRKISESEEKALTTYANVGTATAGGNTVDREFLREIVRVGVDDSPILSRVRKFTITNGQSIVIPTSESTPWRSSGKGITAYWLAEAGEKTEASPVFGQVTMVLEKLITFTPVTDELLEDSAVDMAAFIRDDAGQKINGKLLQAIITDGSTSANVKPMLTAPCHLTTQRATAGSIEFTDIVTMMSQILPSSYQNGDVVWLATPKAKTAIYAMTDDAGRYVFMPNGVSGAPDNTLMGLPYIETHYCKNLGVKGDLFLVDLKEYYLAQKSIKSDESIHFYFQNDVTVFRTVSRWAGQMWLSDDIVGPDSQAYSHVSILGLTSSTGSEVT
ncbi:MAG: phage major capsid protein [Desulfobacterales bacterium]|nr:phage major capsid protein [Desulfobacterales bacterium]